MELGADLSEGPVESGLRRVWFAVLGPQCADVPHHAAPAGIPLKAQHLWTRKDHYLNGV
jgi:hypothetical protein